MEEFMEDLNAYKCSVSPNYELNNILTSLSNVMCGQISYILYITEQLSVSPIYVYNTCFSEWYFIANFK